MKFLPKLALAAVALGFCATSCFGPNKAFNGLNAWNVEVVDQDWAKELIFIGMNVIPVYPIALLIDIWVLNTIEYWGNRDA